MKIPSLTSLGLAVASLAAACLAACTTHNIDFSHATITAANRFDVIGYCAKGDGKTIDSPAINSAIKAAHDNGGGTVYFPAGTYLCYSIHLQSNVALYLEQGATILAATETKTEGYDPPEPNEWDKWQDFGHTHWHNSLIWGENIENVTIGGPGLIHGVGLSKGDRGQVQAPQNAATNPTTRTRTAPAGDPRDTLIPTPGGPRRAPAPNAGTGYPSLRDTLRDGVGNKSIALKNCRNITLRDVSILHGGHFAILATGVDNFTIDNMKIDTNRDGMDIDCCRNVRVSNCSVNSPWDDGICLKACYGLGFLRACENVTITNCFVTGGFHEGTMLDATYVRWGPREGPARNGRIKFGTESNGGFKNITISNCVFDYCQGLAIESVDGGNIENVTVSNLSMRDITSAPIFIRLGNRARGPGNPPPGIIRGINISDIVVQNGNWRYGCVISGIPGHPIEDLSISNIHMIQQGGGTATEAALKPPELETAYPEPNMFGTMPTSGFFIRHVKNLQMHHAEVSLQKDDARPVFLLQDVAGVDLDDIKAPAPPSLPVYILQNVTGFFIHNCPAIPESRQDTTQSSQ